MTTPASVNGSDPAAPSTRQEGRRRKREEDRAREKIGPQPGPQTEFFTSHADIVIYGGHAGGGKTWALLLEPLRYITFRPTTGFYAVFFRRLHTEIVRPGGLWDESYEVYGHTGGDPVPGITTWRWPGNQRVEMHHLQHEKDKYGWKGAQIPLLLFDQLEEFSETQFWYLLSRNRSTCGVRPYIRATANPVPPEDDTGGWLAKLIQWWWDQESGYPIEERGGIVRWFLRDMQTGELEWADDPAAFGEDAAEAMSLTFIPAKLEDNPILLEKDPSYRAKLRAQTLVDHERLAKGNWKVRPEAGKVFNRAWFKIEPVAPPMLWVVRYWDKAATEGGGTQSAGVAIGEDRDGTYWVLDVQAGHWGISDRNRMIKQTAAADRKRWGHQVTTYVEQEPGSGGKESAIFTVKDLAGYEVYADPATGDKIERMSPFAAQARIGNVTVLDAEWTERYLSHMHQVAPPPPKILLDQADASAGAFNKLTLAVNRRRRRTGSTSVRGSVVQGGNR